MGKPWFRVKRHGYGSSIPCSWEGWVTLAVFIAVTLAIAMLARGHAIAGVTATFMAVAVFGVICWRKSDGPWRWRNGED